MRKLIDKETQGKRVGNKIKCIRTHYGNKEERKKTPKKSPKLTEMNIDTCIRDMEHMFIVRNVLNYIFATE